MSYNNNLFYSGLQMPQFLRNSEVRTQMKIISLIVLLCTAMGLTGAGSAIKLRPTNSHATLASVETNWFMPTISPTVAVMAMQTESPGERISVQHEQISELNHKNDLAVIERQSLRDSMRDLQLQQIENFNREEKARVDDFNKLTARMDIAETRVITAGVVLSSIFSVALALLLFFHIDEKLIRNRRKIRSRDEDITENGRTR